MHPVDWFQALIDPALCSIRLGPAHVYQTVFYLPILSFWLAGCLFSAFLFRLFWNRPARIDSKTPTKAGFKLVLATLTIVLLVPAGMLMMAEDFRLQFRRLSTTAALPETFARPAVAETTIALKRLSEHLVAHAAANNGLFPDQPYHLTTGLGDNTDASLWRVPGADGFLFAYSAPFRSVPEHLLGRWIIAWEPVTKRPNHLALTIDGTVLELESLELRNRINYQIRHAVELSKPGSSSPDVEIPAERSEAGILTEINNAALILKQP